MSGRSAYVRKKITETKGAEKDKQRQGNGPSPARGRAKSSGGSSRSSERDDAGMFGNEFPIPPGTGYSTANARFLKFAEPGVQEHEPGLPFHDDTTHFSNHSTSDQSAGSDFSQRESGAHNAGHHGPMPGFAYARARKPVIKTEDVSGIERSGFRSAMDKRSDDVRKGLSKAFGFGKKAKKGEADSARPPSAATIRPSPTQGHEGEGHDAGELPPMPAQLSPHALTWDPDTGAMSPPLPRAPAFASIAPPPLIKRWIGAGRPVQRWNKLRKDPELWDPNGDVLVFLGHKGQVPRPNPSFRLSSHIIEATESRILITLLREGSTDEDVQVPPSPIGAPPMLQRHGGGHLQLGGYGNQRNGQPTPPISEDASLAGSDGQISYEMYFPTPTGMGHLETYRHALTTRNVFALLYHASLVGLSLYQALCDLQYRLDEYLPAEADSVGTILNYMIARGIDDVRNDAETAVSLLAWSETAEVRWEEGWREGFLHCAGMYTQLEACADFEQLTPITRALLERACLECQLRVQAAEGRLAEFTYSDIWPPAMTSTNNPGRAAADRLQQFLKAYYTKAYGGKWPPSPATSSGARTSEGEDMWLTRTVAHNLQRDFGALYDYLVNRDIVWDESETRSSRKWMMVSKSGNRAFDPDSPELPMTDMLIEWDNRSRFPHIPHPYPLVPESIPPSAAPPLSAPSREKGSKKAEKEKEKLLRNGSIVSSHDRLLERRVQLAYTEATNIYILDSDFTHTPLIDAFVKFEKTDHHTTAGVDPCIARRGRWILIYGLLQTLASISVDAPTVRFKDESVAYHLSPRLKGTRTPPWKGVITQAAEAGPELSHCWVVPRTWASAGEGGTADDSDASATSGGGDASPITRMMRAQGAEFPRPPRTATNRSVQSHSSWQTPMTGPRSLQSTEAPPSTVWGGSSAMSTVSSTDDVASASGYSSTRTPSSYSGSRARRGHDGDKSSMRSYATFGAPPMPRETRGDGGGGEWPPRLQSIDTSRAVPRMPPLPVPPPSSPGFGGGFLNLDGSPPGSGTSHGPGARGRTAGRSRGRRYDGDDGGPGPIITDFDFLSVVDDHAP